MSGGESLKIMEEIEALDTEIVNDVSILKDFWLASFKTDAQLPLFDNVTGQAFGGDPMVKFIAKIL